MPRPGARARRWVTEPRRAVDPACLIGLLTLLSATLLSTYAIHGYEFPVGADAPVYIWWSRLAGHDGLGAVAGRPGVPGLTLLVSGVLGTGTATTVAALEVACSCAIAAATAALMFDPDEPRARWLLPAALAGAFALFLAIGYVATLAAAALFLGTCAALSVPGRPPVALAAVLLAAVGLAQPQFLAVGAAVLLAAAALSLRRDRRMRPLLSTDHGRVVVTLVAGICMFAGAMWSIAVGAAPLRADTSRDDVLQRLGLGSRLRGEFRARLVQHAAPFVPALSVPLAVAGAWTATGWRAHLLRGWAGVLVVGVLIGAVTGAVPPERIVTFGFVLPIAGGAALASLPSRISGRPGPRAAVGVAAALAFGALVAGPLLVWFRTPPQLFPLEVLRATEAGRYASSSSPGTPLVFVAKNREPVGAFFATEAANAIRASMPPDRIRDVLVVTPPGPPLAATEENARLVAASLAAASEDPHALWFDLAPFDRTGFGAPLPGGPVTRSVGQGIAVGGAVPASPGPAVDPLAPLTSGGLLMAAVAGTLALLWIAGYGWTRAATLRGMQAFGLAPAAGAAVSILAALLGDRAGLDLSRRGAPLALTAAVSLAGYAVAVAGRRSHRHDRALPSES